MRSYRNVSSPAAIDATRRRQAQDEQLSVTTTKRPVAASDRHRKGHQGAKVNRIGARARFDLTESEGILKGLGACESGEH